MHKNSTKKWTSKNQPLIYLLKIPKDPRRVLKVFPNWIIIFLKVHQVKGNVKEPQESNKQDRNTKGVHNTHVELIPTVQQED